MDAVRAYFDEENRLFVFVWEGSGSQRGSFLTKVLDFGGGVNISMWRYPIEYSINQAISGYKAGYRGNLGIGKTIHDECNIDVKEELKKLISGLLGEQ